MSNSGSKKFNKWVAAVLTAILVLLLLSAALTVIIDPVFHYHAPLNGLAYPLGDSKNQRYINDGILRHFNYDSVIMGSSLVENFKTSEADELFDASFVKVPTAGACFKEVNDQLARAFSYSGEIKYVIRALDLHRIVEHKDAVVEDYEIPEFLYNSNPTDDVEYLFNKDFLLKDLDVLRYTAEGNQTTSFDEYSAKTSKCGKDVVLARYHVYGRSNEQRQLTDDEYNMTVANIEQNVTALAAAHPETTFLYYIPPYSVAYWDELDSRGGVEIFLSGVEIATRMMSEYPNIKIYMFINDFDTVSNLDYYIDQVHYNADISSLLLEYMANGDYLVTEDNLDTLMTEARDFYFNYDYEALHDTEE